MRSAAWWNQSPQHRQVSRCCPQPGTPSSAPLTPASPARCSELQVPTRVPSGRQDRDQTRLKIQSSSSHQHDRYKFTRTERRLLPYTWTQKARRRNSGLRGLQRPHGPPHPEEHLCAGNIEVRVSSCQHNSPCAGTGTTRIRLQPISGQRTHTGALTLRETRHFMCVSSNPTLLCFMLTHQSNDFTAFL